MKPKPKSERGYESWAEAFTIFARYLPNEDWSQVAAEHDIIYAGPSPSVVSAEDTARLEVLGWSVEHDYECFSHNV